jgi:hypothetical protein
VTASKATPRKVQATTETEFWGLCEVISIEIDDAQAISQTLETINELAVHDADILAALNGDALFWNVQTHCLLTSLFITMARVFDAAHEAYSIHKVISQAMEHPEFFSPNALAIRRIRTSQGIKPPWLDLLVRTHGS